MAVAHDLAIQPQPARRGDDRLGILGVRRQQHASAPKREAELSERVRQRILDRLSKRVLGAVGHQHCPVLGDDRVEVCAQAGERQVQLGHDPTGDQHESKSVVSQPVDLAQRDLR